MHFMQGPQRKALSFGFLYTKSKRGKNDSKVHFRSGIFPDLLHVDTCSLEQICTLNISGALELGENVVIGTGTAINDNELRKRQNEIGF